MKALKTIGFVVVLLAIGYFLLPYVKINPNLGKNQEQDVSDPANQAVEIKTFTSDSFGAKLDYNTDQDGDGKTDTDAKESGDKIYVYYTATPMEQGQWVQKFSKDSSETLVAVIQRFFLAEYKPADCYPMTLGDYYKSYDAEPPVLPENVEVAVIAYPKTTDPNLPFWQNAEKCPPTYSATNGASYFWMDKRYPDRFFFFNIGQYAIFADKEGQKAWQDTFTVTK